MEFEQTTHDHTAIDHAIHALAKQLGGGEHDVFIIGWAELAAALERHFVDEETNFFPLLSQRLPGYQDEVDVLLDAHGALRKMVARVTSASEPHDRERAFIMFRSAFEHHSLAEADLIHRTWNILFPELNAGG